MNSRRLPQPASVRQQPRGSASSIAPARPTSTGLSHDEFRAVIADAKRRKALGELITGVGKKRG